MTGSRPSKAVVPARLLLVLPPEPDETFTSWMVRLAAAHGLRPRSLCSLLSGQEVEFSGDFDGAVGDPLLVALARHTGFDSEGLRDSHTLTGFGGRLYARHRPDAATPWVLPQGRFYQQRPSTQFCPECLTGDPPYLRRIWRLSLFGTCPVHGTGLHVVCPGCAAAVNIVRSQMHRGGLTLTLCWKCGHDLRKAQLRPVAEEDVRLAQVHRRALEDGVRPPGWPAGFTVSDYFDGLALLCARLLRRQLRLADWRQLAAAAAGVPAPCVPGSPGARASYNGLIDPAERRPILRTAAWLLNDWPERFLTIARAGQTRTSDFAEAFVVAPAWFLKPLCTRLTPARPKQKFSPGVLRAQAVRAFILEHRREWCPTKLPRLARALRAAGFYDERIEDAFIIADAKRVIAKLRVAGADYRRRATRQVPRDTPEWSRLILLARPFRKVHRPSVEALRQGILRLCTDRFLSARDLGELLHRSPQVLMAYHLSPMVRTGLLRTRLKAEGGNNGLRSHPQQAYRHILHVS